MTDPRFASIRACLSLPPSLPHFPVGVPVEEAISMNGQTWMPGDTIRIGFLDGSPEQQKKTQLWIEYWNQCVNLHFNFTSGATDARITFMPGGSWSYIGTGCRSVRSGPTMQLGWVTDTSDSFSDRAVIVHEAGHMIGLGHEQSSPLEDIQWNKPLAMQYYMSTQGWTEQMVQDNVFAVFEQSQITGTPYDRTSIMQYPVPAQLTLDGRGIDWNTDLSLLDRTYTAILYPGVVQPPPQPPIIVPQPPIIVAPPVQPPVQPPVPPPDQLPVIRIGAPAVHTPIPQPGDAARFRLDVPADMNLNLTVQIEPSFGGMPIVRVAWSSSGGGMVKLGLKNGQVKYHFNAGTYTVGIWNPRPRQTGMVSVRARHAPN